MHISEFNVNYSLPRKNSVDRQPISIYSKAHNPQKIAEDKANKQEVQKPP